MVYFRLLVPRIEYPCELFQYSLIVGIDVWGHYAAPPILHKIIWGSAVLASTNHLKIVNSQDALFPKDVNNDTIVNNLNNLIAEKREKKKTESPIAARSDKAKMILWVVTYTYKLIW